MDDWKPLEIVALAAVAAVAVFLGALARAWYLLRNRQFDLAACTTDDLAARILAENLAKVRVPADGVEEIMTAFIRMDSASKRSMTSAVAGIVAATDKLLRPTLDDKVRSIVRGFSMENSSSSGSEGAR